MAERRATGLSFGQLITLTFGFLLASVLIFVFGIGIGFEVAEQRAAREREVGRVPVAPPPAAPPTAARVAAIAQSTPTAAIVAQTATPSRPPTSPTVLIVVKSTATRAPIAAATLTPTGTWTVQAYATNDTVRAVMLARTLRAKGYDASTATKQVSGATWYVVRVGRFRDRTAAKALESKLRSEEGLEAASVIVQ